MRHGPIAPGRREHAGRRADPQWQRLRKDSVQSRGSGVAQLTRHCGHRPQKHRTGRVAWEIVEAPAIRRLLLSMLLTVPPQLLAYHIAAYRGTGVYRPRNLAKSVTVDQRESRSLVPAARLVHVAQITPSASRRRDLSCTCRIRPPLERRASHHAVSCAQSGSPLSPSTLFRM